MPLSEAHLAKIKNHLQGKLTKCPVCAGTKIDLGFESGTIISYDIPGNMVKLDHNHPIVIAICASCGYVMPFSAKKAGLL